MYGAGKSPAWLAGRNATLADDAALVEPLLARAGLPVVLVGHSYGAALTLVMAVSRPERIKALVLYEPTLFSLRNEEAPAPNDADGIRHAVADATTAVDVGWLDLAAERFIDYWMDAGS